MDEKMYVLVREDLTPSQQAVQAGHAVIKYVIRDPFGPWEDLTLVYLGVRDGERLRRWSIKLDDLGIPFELFKEPDLDNAATALAVFTDDHKVFQSLRLALFVPT